MRTLSCVELVAKLFREKERRLGEPEFVHGEAVFQDESGHLAQAVICELSARNCSVVTACELRVGDRLRFGVLGMPAVEAVVIQHEDSRYSCQFSTLVPNSDWFSLGPPVISRLAAGPQEPAVQP